MRKAGLLLLAAVCSFAQAQAADTPPRNVILVTLDGMRWQEVFRGIDSSLATDEKFNRLGQPLRDMFAAATPAESARKLFPFLQGVVARRGVLIGNRDKQSCARVTNPWYFSYPGYSEILTGKVDESINTNDAIPNRNITFMEWLNKSVPTYRNKVRAFGSWSTFTAIFNAERSGIPVITGPLQSAETSEEKTLVQLETNLPTLWPKVRLDAFTHLSALHSMQRQNPRVLYVAFDETDDFSHDGRYDEYLIAAHRTDGMLQQLWNEVQTNPFYKDNTVLFITTDHGRGAEPTEIWQHHGSKASLAGYQKSLARFTEGIVGSDAVWMAAIGAGVPAGEPKPAVDCVGSNQIAATLLTLMGLKAADFSKDIGAPIKAFLP